MHGGGAANAVKSRPSIPRRARRRSQSAHGRTRSPNFLRWCARRIKSLLSSSSSEYRGRVPRDLYRPSRISHEIRDVRLFVLNRPRVLRRADTVVAREIDDYRDRRSGASKARSEYMVMDLPFDERATFKRQPGISGASIRSGATKKSDAVRARNFQFAWKLRPFPVA